MSFLLVGSTREALEAALSAACLEVLVEGKPAEVAHYISEHREELSELAFITHFKITPSPTGYDIEWPADLAMLGEPVPFQNRIHVIDGHAAFLIAIKGAK